MKTITAGGFRAGHALTLRLTIFVMMVVMMLASFSSPFPLAEAFCVVRPSTRVTRSTNKSAQQQHGFFSSSELSNNKFSTTTRTSRRYATEQGSDDNNNEKQGSSSLKFLLDPGTKGGAVFLSLLLFLVPIVFYNIILATVPDVDALDVGKWIGAGFTILATLAWVSTYIFRVATKDMTYAKQLKDYENAVIAKRLEELDDDELQALVEEVERDDF